MKRRAIFLFLTAFLTAQSAQEVEITAEPHHQLVLANDQVRVFNVDVSPAPGGVIPLHHHGRPHLVVALTDYELRSDVKGKGSAIITMKRGESRWAAGGYSHILTNTSHNPAKFITLEFR